MRNPIIGVILTGALMLPAVAQNVQQPATIGGHPNFNGIWQAINGANWNLEAHSAQSLDRFWGLGAIAAIPAGKSVVREGTIPYLPAALEQRNKNKAAWPDSDPEAKCYMLGVPRVTYHGMPFQIAQGDAAGDIVMVYPFEATNRIIYMHSHEELPVESWMGRSYGSWDGKTLVILTTDQNDKTQFDRAGNFHTTALKVTERFTLMDATHIRYEATMDDPKTFSKPWTIEMILYKNIEPNAEILEHKCVTFADRLLYSDLMHLTPQSIEAATPSVTPK